MKDGSTRDSMNEPELESLDKRVSMVLPILNERQRRLYLAAEAMTDEISLSELSRISGVSRNTIASGIKEMQEDDENQTNAVYTVRRSGAGRKKIDEEFPNLPGVLEELLEKKGRSNELLLWSGLSIREIREFLKEEGHWIGRTTVSNALQESGFVYHDTDGSLDDLMDSMREARESEIPVIDIEIIGTPTEPLPWKAWRFIQNWWERERMIVVSSLPERDADAFPGITYLRYPKGHMKWRQRTLSASLRIEEQGGNIVRCMLWQIN